MTKEEEEEAIFNLGQDSETWGTPKSKKGYKTYRKKQN